MLMLEIKFWISVFVEFVSVSSTAPILDVVAVEPASEIVLSSKAKSAGFRRRGELKKASLSTE